MSGVLKRLERKTVYQGKVLDFCKDTVELPNGKIEEWDFVHHIKGGGACVVPVLPDGRILMIRQFRPAVGRTTLELPAGARDDREDPAVTAGRELREETGYSAGKMTFLASIDTAVAYCDERTDIYLAEELVREGEQELDDAESIGIAVFPLEDLLKMIFEGILKDAKTVAGITSYAAFTWGNNCTNHCKK